jgi:hypothetical protein
MENKQLISPLVNYMTEQQMVCDAYSEISESAKPVEFVFQSTGIYGLQIWKPYYFNPDTSLNGSTIKGIEVLTTTQLGKSTTNNTPVSSLDVLSNLLLWLVDDKGEAVCTLPLWILGAGNSTADKIQRFNLKNIIWQDCYITTHDTTGLSAGTSILFNVYYDKKEEQ